MSQTDAYYTYQYLREDGSPYYVGKGKGRRAYLRYKGHWAPEEKARITFQFWSDNDTALAFERYLIDFWGRKDIGTGILRNLTDGGENPPSSKGKQRPAVTRQRMTKPKTAEHAKNISLGRTGIRFSDTHRANLIRSCTGHRQSPLSKARKSIALQVAHIRKHALTICGLDAMGGALCQ